MTNRTVRQANAGDVDDLVNLRAEMFRAMGIAGHADTPWRDSAVDWFANRVDNDEYRIAVVDSGGRVCATAMGAIRDSTPSPSNPHGRDVLVSNVCTAPDARRQGHARAALKHVMEWAGDTGAGRAELVATASGVSMYREAGFQDTDYPAMRAPLTQPAVGIRTDDRPNRL